MNGILEDPKEPEFMKGMKSENEFIFLRCLAVYGNIGQSCTESGLSREYVHRRKKSDPEFKARFDEAMEIGNSALEDEARRRAHDGVPEPIFYQGVEVGTVQKYSDSLLITLLKANMPEKFADRTKSELTGAGGLPFQIDQNVRQVVEKAMEEFEKDY